ncbi:sporulation protein YunB [Ructibacterium gallinarum]|uniref:Sporulation protein YunB n=1 Tax=Ructibacterium gallinarum TaxID=2779355 RepID=A0A9D5M379_9FIRM|nr:sporulation protein YunB [Ructibacterium gallinarum]MBE5040703.1 sporulation protein YunB [Ructibacterium gallinarum]
MPILLRKLKYRFRPSAKHRNKKRPHSPRHIVWILILLMIPAFLYIFYQAERRIGPLAQQAAVSKLNGEITKSTNQVIQDILKAQSLNTQDLILSEKDENGHLTAMSVNFSAVNQIKSTLAIEIQNCLDQMEVIHTSVPAGMLFSDTLMTGMGIQIPIKVFAVSAIEVDFIDEFSSAGINQTRYQLMVEVRVPARVAGIFLHEDTEIVTQVPVAETIVVGDVPSAYLAPSGN